MHKIILLTKKTRNITSNLHTTISILPPDEHIYQINNAASTLD